MQYFLLQKKAVEVRSQKGQLKRIEDLGAAMEERLILDNRYTEHSTVGLAQQWDQLDQLGMRMQHNLDQQIQARNRSGVSEDALREFSMMFKHFDKDKSGKLDHQEFKSCLRALGYDLPVVEEGQTDPEFQGILDMVDPNRYVPYFHPKYSDSHAWAYSVVDPGLKIIKLFSCLTQLNIKFVLLINLKLLTIAYSF